MNKSTLFQQVCSAVFSGISPRCFPSFLAVWGQDYDGTYRTVDTIIKQLRIKLGEECPYIKSIYGIGYIFEIENI